MPSLRWHFSAIRFKGMGGHHAPSKKSSKRKHRACAVPLLGAAGLSLSLASGASAATGGPAADMPTQNTAVSHEVTLGEEEISDVSLATFYVFDKENPSIRRTACRAATLRLPWAAEAATEAAEAATEAAAAAEAAEVAEAVAVAEAAAGGVCRLQMGLLKLLISSPGEKAFQLPSNVGPSLAFSRE